MAREWFPALRRAFTGSPETKGLPERVRASSSGYVVPGVPYSSNWNVRRAVEEGYEGNPLVYRAIEVICTNAATRRIVLFDGDPEDKQKMISEVGKDPTRLLYCLNRRANPWETALIFRHRLVAQFLLSSRGCYIEVVRTRSNRFGLLNLLDPDLVRMIASETNPIAAFEVKTPNSSVNAVNYLPPFDPSADWQSQPSSVLWIRAPHPLVMWEGMSPVQAAGLPIDLDRYARIYNRRFLQNDGRPGGLLSVKGTVDRATMELIQAQFNGGPESAGRTTVIQADAVSYADTSGSPRDLMWGELSRMTKSDIAIAFGVPESVLGDASGRTFDNADAEYAMFWEHRMLPLLRLLDDQLDILTGGHDDDLYLRHDLSGVWVLGRHDRERADRAAGDLERGAISYDDYREVIGRKRVGAPATSVLWLSTVGKMAVSDDEDQAREAVESPVAMPGGTPGEEEAPVLGAPPAVMPARLGSAEADGLRTLPAAGRRVAALPSGGDREDARSLEGKQRPPR